MSAHCDLRRSREEMAKSLKPARTLLRNMATGEYFKGLSNWTTDIEQAFNFRAVDRALRFVRDAGLEREHLEVIFAFEDSRYNVPMPIDERFEPHPAR